MFDSARINVSISAQTSVSRRLNEKFRNRKLNFRLEIGIPKAEADSIVYAPPGSNEMYSVRDLLRILASKGIDPLHPIFEHQVEIRRYIQTGVLSLLQTGGKGVRSMLYDYGRKWVRIIQQYIIGGAGIPSLSPKTIKRREYKKKEYPGYYKYPKGIGQPLVETGLLINSITFRITELPPRDGTDENPWRWTSGKRGRPAGSKDKAQRIRLASEAEWRSYKTKVRSMMRKSGGSVKISERDKIIEFVTDRNGVVMRQEIEISPALGVLTRVRETQADRDRRMKGQVKATEKILDGIMPTIKKAVRVGGKIKLADTEVSITRNSVDDNIARIKREMYYKIETVPKTTTLMKNGEERQYTSKGNIVPWLDALRLGSRNSKDPDMMQAYKEILLENGYSV